MPAPPRDEAPPSMPVSDSPKPPTWNESGTASAQPPLVVDVDGSLVRSNLLWEGATQLLLRGPWHLIGMARALTRGRAALKAYVAERARLDLDTVPLEPSVVNMIHEALGAGREV